MRKICISTAAAVAALIAGLQGANAGLLGMPMGLHAAIQHVRFETPTSSPAAFTFNCLCHDNAGLPAMVFRGSPYGQIADEHWAGPNDVDIATTFSLGSTTR